MPWSSVMQNQPYSHPAEASMNLEQYRASAAEQLRTADLLKRMPNSGGQALDIGARDGHFSRLLADRFDKVVALDLVRPTIIHPRVENVEGNAARMPFADGSFDLVFCAEVLEHIPTALLRNVCQEIERVANGHILIGVPYKQDIRIGRATCYSCGHVNPPWGHVNSFDEVKLSSLFKRCKVAEVSFVGTNSSRTNAVSAALMDFAGNPFGTYDQEEACIHCGRRLIPPPRRSVAQRAATRLAHWSRKASEWMASPHGNWMHAMLHKIDASQSRYSVAASSATKA